MALCQKFWTFSEMMGSTDFRFISFLMFYLFSVFKFLTSGKIQQKLGIKKSKKI